jgi:transposase
VNFPRLSGDFQTRFDLFEPRKEVIVVAPKKYPDELRERAVRLYRESDPKPVIRRLAEQLNVHPEALRNWIRQDEADRGQRHDRPSTDLAEENRRLRREVAELQRVNDVLRAASAYFASEIGPTRRTS